MYLLLASGYDRLSQLIADGLKARGRNSLIVNSTFGDGLKFSWRLDNNSSNSELTLSDGRVLSGDQIEGVLVRSIGWIDPSGWQPEDLAYVHTETQAALLGWLKALSCPVIGRLPASIWYRPQMPISCWQPLLARCGLNVTETLVTNVERELESFRQTTPIGAVYSPFSSVDRYLVDGDSDWNGLAALAACAPVCLAVPHGETKRACLIGDQVVWDGEPPEEANRIASALIQFAAFAELNFVEFATSESSDGVSIVGVNPIPSIELFSDGSQQMIAQCALNIFTGAEAHL
ncbi:MAG TPA: hypothetical protein VKN18_22540 [Blastocatellia bacterium]|nr:hypothetical protein [Blastocatellia bacterium]